MHRNCASLFCFVAAAATVVIFDDGVDDVGEMMSVAAVDAGVCAADAVEDGAGVAAVVVVGVGAVGDVGVVAAAASGVDTAGVGVDDSAVAFSAVGVVSAAAVVVVGAAFSFLSAATICASSVNRNASFTCTRAINAHSASTSPSTT